MQALHLQKQESREHEGGYSQQIRWWGPVRASSDRFSLSAEEEAFVDSDDRRCVWGAGGRDISEKSPLGAWIS